MSLAPLTALRKLNLLGNKQSELEIPEGSFQELEVLHRDLPISICKVFYIQALSTWMIFKDHDNLIRVRIFLLAAYTYVINDKPSKAAYVM